MPHQLATLMPHQLTCTLEAAATLVNDDISICPKTLQAYLHVMLTTLRRVSKTAFGMSCFVLAKLPGFMAASKIKICHCEKIAIPPACDLNHGCLIPKRNLILFLDKCTCSSCKDS
jgi:hypothetical protein